MKMKQILSLFLAVLMLFSACGGENKSKKDFFAMDTNISITVYGHRRNSFGPFYMNEATPFWNGPLQFKTRQQDDKQLVPCGLLSDVKLVY